MDQPNPHQPMVVFLFGNADWNDVISQLPGQPWYVAVLEFEVQATLMARCAGGVVLVWDTQIEALRDNLADAQLNQWLPIFVLTKNATTTLPAGLWGQILMWPPSERTLADEVRQWGESSSLRLKAIRRSRAAEFMKKWAKRLDSSDLFEDVLSEGLRRLTEQCGATRAEVYVLAEGRGQICLVARSDEMHVARLPVDSASYPHLPRLLEMHRDAVFSASDAIDPRIVAALKQRGIRAIVSAPLFDEGDIYGVLDVQFVEQSWMVEEVMDLIRLSGDIVGPRLRHSELFAALRDSTQNRLKLNASALTGHAEQHNYEAFFRRSFDGVLVVDQQLCIRYLNPAGEQMTGYAHDGVVGRSILDIVSEQERVDLQQSLNGLDETDQQPRHFDLSLITTSGDVVWTSVSTSTAILDDAAVWVLNFRDVTETRTLSQELSATKEFLERLIDSTVDAIVAGNAGGRVVLFNQSAEQLFGLTRDNVIGHLELSDLFPEEVFESLMQKLRPNDPETMDHLGRLEDSRQEIVNSKRERIFVQMNASLMFDHAEVVGIVVVMTDLRDRLRMERRLAEAQEQLIETERQAALAELAGTTAHELNQPLTSVMAGAELLGKRVAADDPNRRTIDVIIEESERMAAIVKKIGKITRYETQSYVGRAQILDLDKSSPNQ